MKPIFEIERKFLENKLGVVIPKYSWRTTGNELYFNAADLENKKQPFLKFSVIDGQDLVVTYYNSESIIDENYIIDMTCGSPMITPVKTWIEEYFFHKDEIERKFKESQRQGLMFINKYPNAEIRPGVSGGKDSQLAYHILQTILKDMDREYYTDYFNTSNETADTYKFVKYHAHYHNLAIHNPDIGFHVWLRDVKNDFLPSRTVRTCCQMFKEDRLLKNLDLNKEYILVLGVRKHESSSRSYYDFDLNKSVIDNHGKDKLNVPENFRRLALIVDWKDHEVWLYTLYNNLPINKMYEYGFNRVGCTVCFNQSDYIDVLVKEYYPTLWAKWEKAIRRNYKTHRIDRLNWTEDEWLHKWKDGVSKEYHLLRLKPTPERIAQVAEIKGISTKLAEKFFKRSCSCCKTKSGKPKLLNSTEVSMNLKFFGRQESLSMEQELSRKFLCKSCMCKYMGWKKDDYKYQVERFLNDGCELFVKRTLVNEPLIKEKNSEEQLKVEPSSVMVLKITTPKQQLTLF